MKTFFDVVAFFMAVVLVVGIGKIAYDRYVNGPPCHKVAEHNYLCNF